MALVKDSSFEEFEEWDIGEVKVFGDEWQAGEMKHGQQAVCSLESRAENSNQGEAQQAGKAELMIGG